MATSGSLSDGSIRNKWSPEQIFSNSHSPTFFQRWVSSLRTWMHLEPAKFTQEVIVGAYPHRLENCPITWQYLLSERDEQVCLIQLTSALNKLSIMTQEIFIQCFVERRQQQEIAMALGIRLSVVENCLVRAMKHCREQLLGVELPEDMKIEDTAFDLLMRARQQKTLSNTGQIEAWKSLSLVHQQAMENANAMCAFFSNIKRPDFGVAQRFCCFIERSFAKLEDHSQYFTFISVLVFVVLIIPLWLLQGSFTLSN